MIHSKVNLVNGMAVEFFIKHVETAGDLHRAIVIPRIVINGINKFRFIKSIGREVPQTSKY